VSLPVSEYGRAIYDSLITMFKMTDSMGRDLVFNIVRYNLNLEMMIGEFQSQLAIQRSGLSHKELKLRSMDKLDEPNFNVFTMALEVSVSHETLEINKQHDRTIVSVMTTMVEGDDLSEQLRAIEKSRSKQLERNIAALKTHRKEVYLEAHQAFQKNKKIIAKLSKEITELSKYVVDTVESIEFITFLVTIIESIKNKILPKVNENTVVCEKLDVTVTIGADDIGTPVADRDLSGILMNLVKCFKGGDIGSFFHELINLFGMKNNQLNNCINKIDEVNKNWKSQNLIEKYLTKSNLYGMLVINSLTDEQEKTLLIKHCLKYFTLMTNTTIDTVEDMNDFVSKNGTLLSVIRVYSDNKESMDKLKGTRVVVPADNEPPLDFLTTQLASLSHDQLQQMLADLGDDEFTSTTNDATKRMTNAEVMEDHMASGCAEDSVGRTYYPINRSGLKFPLYASIKEANLKNDVVIADGIRTMVDNKSHTYESFKSMNDVPVGHFTENNQCKRCKGFGHFSQKCLQEVV
jgi:hypothetical protein